jgi:hypothetical protein
MWGPAGEKGASYWLNHLNAANSDPTSRKWGVVRGTHRCPTIPALLCLSKRQPKYQRVEINIKVTASNLIQEKKS